MYNTLMTYEEFKNAVLKASKRHSCKLYIKSISTLDTWHEFFADDYGMFAWTWVEFERLLEDGRWDNHHDFYDNTTVINVDGYEYKIQLFTVTSLEDL